MPYPGVDNKNIGWMDRCVTSVMGQGKDKGSAIAICKTQLDKKKSDSAFDPDGEIEISREIMDNVEIFLHQAHKVVLSHFQASSVTQARDICLDILLREGSIEKAIKYIDRLDYLWP